MVDLIAITARHPLLILLILVGVYSIIQRSFWPFLISTLVLGVLAGAGHQYFPGRFFKISFDGVFFAAGGAFEHYRLARFQTAFNILREHPFFGIGFEHVRILFEQYYPLKSELVSISHEHRILDNMYLTILAETGMIGFIGFFLAMGRILILGCRTYMQTYSLHLFIALLVLLGFFLSMTSYEVIYWPAPLTIFSLFCGIICGLTAPQDSKSV
ncbi:O-antigen ligase family protein [PVC group bacterium]|nr:O-antigen ligase family protein [PVC group bacterium]